MIRVGLLPKLIKLLGQSDIKNKTTILGLLYHASMDDKVKAMFINTECIQMVSRKVIFITINNIHKSYEKYQNVKKCYIMSMCLRS